MAVLPNYLSGQVAETDSHLVRRGLAEFECAALATLFDDAIATEEHFGRGMALIRSFIVKAQDGDVSEEEWSDVPIVISMNLGGPSIDFMVGVIWAQTYDRLSEETWNEFENTPWEEMEELQDLNATMAFQNKNCPILR